MSEFTPLKLPDSTPFPVKIISIDVQPQDLVKKHQQILRYSYWEFQDAPIDTNNEDSIDKYKQPQKIRVDLIGSYESPIDGVIQALLISKGDEILSSDDIIANIIEPCTHSIQYGGLCALCGKSIEDEDDYSGFKNEDRAPISMSHGTSDLKISKDEAEKVEERWTKTLISEKKLILVVDLDQTVIHATVDPTIGEWMKDGNNPNYPSLADVQSFTLEEETILPPNYQGVKPPPHNRWYFVKLRPGLEKFLERISQIYELHIYTMGTRAYAKSIAKCIDPEGKFFADRILSRDESGSLTTKSLERLFPTDTSMVVIIDDRGDVWNWSDHLIKVVPFDFFVGIGDINSNFLPRQKSLLGPSRRRGSIAKFEEQLLDKNDTKDAKLDKTEDGVPNDEVLSEEQNAELLAARSSEREASLEAQKEERPLAKLQKDLDKFVSNDKELERLLYDDDDELNGLEKALVNIHDIFYDQLESGNNQTPDIATILPSIRVKIFEGLVFVFSGLFPLGSNIQNESTVIWVKSFGAIVRSDITLETTHVITKSPHTYKARLAKSLSKDIKVVHPNWIFDSLTYWRRGDENEFEIKIEEDKILGEEEVSKYKNRLKELEEKSKDTDAVQELSEEDNLLGGDMNWLGADDEVEDFLNSDSDEDEDEDEDSESETIQNKRSIEDDVEEGVLSVSKRQKKEEQEDEDDDEDEDEDDLAAELMLELDDDDDDDAGDI